MIMISTITFGAIPIHILIGIIYLAFHEYVAAIMTFGVCASYTSGLILFQYQPKYYQFVKNFQLFNAIISPFLGTILLGGIANAAFSLVWGLVAPILSLLISNLYDAFVWFLAFLLTIFVSVLSIPYLRTSNNIPDSIISIMISLNLTGISTLIFFAIAFATNQRNILLKSLSLEKEKTENLLLNILPKEIAEILKNSDQPIADHFDEVTVLFADIVGFTPMCSAMSAIETVEILNEVFSYFDILTDKYQVEKIKTIGDCYMVASGIPCPNIYHAQTLVQMALEIQNHVSHHLFRGRKLQFRIGLNSGSVVAGVIGQRKFIYDLWGDTVNTASRMESYSSANHIQVTKDTYNLIKDEFICEFRGIINVKGKGEMEVYLVKSALSS